MDAKLFNETTFRKAIKYCSKNISIFCCVKLHGFHGNQLCDFRELGCTYKLTHISAATHPRLLNIVSNKRLDITIIPNGRKCKLSYFNIHECLMKTLEMREES